MKASAARYYMALFNASLIIKRRDKDEVLYGQEHHRGESTTIVCEVNNLV